MPMKFWKESTRVRVARKAKAYRGWSRKSTDFRGFKDEGRIEASAKTNSGVSPLRYAPVEMTSFK